VRKPHRWVLNWASGSVAEAAAFLRRRKQARRPFAQVYWPGGRGTRFDAQGDAGRALFVASAELIKLARSEARNG
jgi:hypothetical protein